MSAELSVFLKWEFLVLPYRYNCFQYSYPILQFLAKQKRAISLTKFFKKKYFLSKIIFGAWNTKRGTFSSIFFRAVTPEIRNEILEKFRLWTHDDLHQMCFSYVPISPELEHYFFQGKILFSKKVKIKKGWIFFIILCQSLLNRTLTHESV